MTYKFYSFSAYPNNYNSIFSINLEHNQYSIVLCQPTLKTLFKSGLPIVPFGVWWAFQRLNLFANKDYWLLFIIFEDNIVHRSVVFPRYFRFPFMAKDDLQIGDTWTALDHRNKGLATFALLKIINSLNKPGRNFWYVTLSDNVSSIRVVEKARFAEVGEGYRNNRFGMRILGYFAIKPQESVDLIQ